MKDGWTRTWKPTESDIHIPSWFKKKIKGSIKVPRNIVVELLCVSSVSMIKS